MTKKKDKNGNLINVEDTFKQGVGGGILGAFVGVPGAGAALGMLHANKDKFDDLLDEKKIKKKFK